MSQFPPPFPQQPPIQQPQRQQFQVPGPSGSGTEYQSWQQSTQPQSIPPYPYPPELPRQPMPPAPKPKHHLRKLWIAVALVVVVLFAAIAGISLHAHQNPAPASTTQVKVTQPSNQLTQPVDHPTAHPTSAPAQPGASTIPAILGADLSTFITKYGQVIQVQGGYYTFKTGGIEVMVGNDPPPYATRALAIVYNAPNGHLSINDATNACVALSPSDAQYQYNVTLTGAHNQIVGVEIVYFSASLAKQFPASEFVDGHLKATKPGTFGIVLNYGPGSNTQVTSCSTQVSLQGN